jgi:hypothetical protein
MSDDKRKAIRERVLARLDAADVGSSENWRDEDPGYWIGVEEGAYDVETDCARLRASLADREREIERLRGVLSSIAGYCAEHSSQSAPCFELWPDSPDDWCAPCLASVTLRAPRASRVEEG